MGRSPFFLSPTVAVDEIRCRTDGIVILLHVNSSGGKCPVCGKMATRIHSSYERRIVDLPWLGTPVCVLWRSRRLFCDNPLCSRRIFTERCPELAAPYARRTSRLTTALNATGLICGGEPGARLAKVLGIPTSGDTLLRIMRGNPPVPSATPRVLGVDDWAIRRGQHYGTVICDLERHCIVDLLPDRSAESFANWLKDHPGVQVISRDRGDNFIKGATDGAPTAVQVADRWHLLKNLGDALLGVLDRHATQVQSAAIDAADAVELAPAIHVPIGGSEVPVEEEQKSVIKPQALAEMNRRSRLKKFQDVNELHNQGVSAREIARRLGMHRSTVGRYIRCSSFPERKKRHYKRSTDPFDAYLRQRWQAGCHNARHLTEELMTRGFKGSYPAVRRKVAAWRTDSRCRTDRSQRMSSRQALWTLLKPQDEQTVFEQAFESTICTQCPAVAAAQHLAKEFRAIMKGHREAELTQWLKNADGSDLNVFAQGLEADLEAVRGALSLAWSNGQTEGHVNRIKAMKRQMYGRAKIDLLRIRLLPNLLLNEVAE